MSHLHSQTSPSPPHEGVSPLSVPPKPSLGLDALGWEDPFLGAEAVGVPRGPAERLEAGDGLVPPAPAAGTSGAADQRLVSHMNTPPAPSAQ